MFESIINIVKDHSFSTYAKFSKKLMRAITYLSVTGGKKCYFFGKFCAHTTSMIPYEIGLKLHHKPLLKKFIRSSTFTLCEFFLLHTNTNLQSDERHPFFLFFHFNSHWLSCHKLITKEKIRFTDKV